MSGVRRLVGWWRAHPFVVDVGWTVALLLFTLVASIGGVVTAGPVWVLLTVAVIVPLAWRRRAPGAVAGVVAAVQFAQLLLVGVHEVLPANFFATVVVMYSVTAYGRDRDWQAYLGLALLGCLLLSVTGLAGEAVSAATSVVGATLAGYLRRIVRVRDEAAVERARRLEVERDSAATVAAEQERRRIARDLHDVIAHSLTVIVAQADGGRYAARSDPEAAVRALETVAASGRGALTDLRAALGALRSPGLADTSPLPGLTDVPSLVASVRDSGHPVVLDVVGRPAELSSGAGLTVYRVVQESLTNVLKHAGPGVTATVRLEHRPAGTTVTVLDDGIGSASRARDGRATDAGMGLGGMRDRVAALGGTLVAGPRTGGGWLVRAEIPAGPLAPLPVAADAAGRPA